MALLHGTLGVPVVPATTADITLTLCVTGAGGCTPFQTLTGVAGTFADPSFVAGRRITLSGGNAGIWAGSYTISSIAADRSSITLAEILPIGVTLTTEQVPTANVVLTHVAVGVLLDDVTTSDPSGNPATRTQSYERINYDTAINGRLIVNGLGGNDAFFSDDVTATTTLDGGAGNDSFQVGQIYGLAARRADRRAGRRVNTRHEHARHDRRLAEPAGHLRHRRDDARLAERRRLAAARGGRRHGRRPVHRLLEPGAAATRGQRRQRSVRGPRASRSPRRPSAACRTAPSARRRPATRPARSSGSTPRR